MRFSVHIQGEQVMLIKSTLLFVIAVFVNLTISPSHGADTVSCDMLES